jgi:hypothetical protein
VGLLHRFPLQKIVAERFECQIVIGTAVPLPQKQRHVHLDTAASDYSCDTSAAPPALSFSFTVAHEFPNQWLAPQLSAAVGLSFNFLGAGFVLLSIGATLSYDLLSHYDHPRNTCPASRVRKLPRAKNCPSDISVGHVSGGGSWRRTTAHAP